MMPGPRFDSLFGTEILYSFVIIVCSLMVYFATRGIYELSSHKGIKYFRQAFLFFAIAYLFRSLIKFTLIVFNLSAIFDISPFIFGVSTLFLYIYFSAISVFYLLYSVMWKKWNGSSKKVYLFHALAFAIALVSIMSRGFVVHIGLNILFFLIIILMAYMAYKNSERKKHWLYAIYMLLFVFWILNIIDIVIPQFFQTIRLVIYIISVGIFLTILYKVLKKAGSS